MDSGPVLILVLSAGENLHAHKIPRFRGGVFGVLQGGGRSADFIFVGGDFSGKKTDKPTQKAADVWKKDAWDFQAFSQTFLELRFSLGHERKDDKNLNSQTWPDVLLPHIRDHPIHRGGRGEFINRSAGEI